MYIAIFKQRQNINTSQSDMTIITEICQRHILADNIPSAKAMASQLRTWQSIARKSAQESTACPVSKAECAPIQQYRSMKDRQPHGISLMGSGADLQPKCLSTPLCCKPQSLLPPKQVCVHDAGGWRPRQPSLLMVLQHLHSQGLGGNDSVAHSAQHGGAVPSSDICAQANLMAQLNHQP